MMRQIKSPSLREMLNSKLYNATDRIYRRAARVRAAFPLLVSALGSHGEEVVERLFTFRKIMLPLESRSGIANKPQTRRDGMAEQQELDEEHSRL
eukprot:6583113-Pyramimonas_sp.AAC.1